MVVITGNYSATLLEFSFQAQGIAFSDWISLLTLCLAPLIAHIISGAPPAVYLCRKRPRFQDHICILNPTTILWRYFAITDRRIRARRWTPAHLAASNAYFWTARGWDGSEDMVHRSRPYCLRLPKQSVGRLLSADTAQSLIISLQGVQAVYTLVTGVMSLGFVGTIAIDSIFFPLAVFGLLRLCAAFWLTDDYSYSENDQVNSTSDGAKLDVAHDAVGLADSRSRASMVLLDPPGGSSFEKDAFHPANSWRGWAWRIAYLLPITGLWILCVLYLLPWTSNSSFTTTTFLLVLFYLIFLSASIAIYAFYFLRGLSTTTVIPCITSTWYKIYTALLLSMMVVLIVIAGLETRKTPCGTYTTWPNIGVIDQQVCPGLVPVTSNSTNQAPFGLAIWSNNNQTGLREGNITIMNYDGWCQGTVGNDIRGFVPKG